MRDAHGSGGGGRDRPDAVVREAEEAGALLALQRAAHHAERCRLSELSRVEGAETRVGDGWWAVRTGLRSNDLNGVLSAPGHVPDATLLAETGSWFGPAPATWQLDASDERLAGAALRAGWQPERGARCAGRLLPLPASASDRPVPVLDDIALRLVDDEAGLADWLDVAQESGWFDADERHGRASLARALSWSRWVAYRDEEPVGMATGWRDGEGAGWRDGGIAELVDVAVLPTVQRRGVGTALVDAVAAWAATATWLVAAPSPDGWALLATLGFDNVPALADTVAYWPG